MKADGPKNAPLPPIRQQPTLQQKERQKVEQQQTQKLSSTDAARLASRAGFQRYNRKNKRGLDLGDAASQQYALPDDELDPEVWTAERLDDARGSLALASAQFGEVAAGSKAGVSLGASVVGSSYMPTAGDIEAMEDIANREPQQPMPMLEDVTTHVGKLFGIDLGDDVPLGHKMLAAGLVVAGEQDAVHVGKGKLEEGPLAGGIEKVAKRGNQAVGEAQMMNKGINEKLNVQRTFVAKR